MSWIGAARDLVAAASAGAQLAREIARLSSATDAKHTIAMLRHIVQSDPEPLRVRLARMLAQEGRR